MTLKTTILSACLAACAIALAGPARAEEGAAAAAEANKTYKERINTVARAPNRWDIDYLKSKDRSEWRGFTTWQGIRDERPLVARKTMGFHAPRPHATRWERVMNTARGPIRGPAPAK